MITLENVFYDDAVPNWHIVRRKSLAYIVILAEEGQLYYRLDSKTIQVSKGDVLLIRPGTVRSGNNAPESTHRKYSAHFQLDASSGPLPVETEHTGYKLLRPRSYEYLRQRFGTLLLAWRDKNCYQRTICMGIMIEIWGHLMHELEQQNLPSHKLRMVKEIEAYMVAHYKEKVELPRLAELFGRTPNYITAIFKEVTGQTPIEYVNQLRISKARDLLLHTNMNITEVSDYLGFCDPTYFNKVYKKITGQPPSVLLQRGANHGRCGGGNESPARISRPRLPAPAPAAKSGGAG